MKVSINKAQNQGVSYKVSPMYDALKSAWENAKRSSEDNSVFNDVFFKNEYERLANGLATLPPSFHNTIKAIDWAIRSFKYANCDVPFKFTNEIVNAKGNRIAYLDYKYDGNSKYITKGQIASLAPAFTLSVAYNITLFKFNDIKCGIADVSAEDCSVYEQVVFNHNLSGSSLFDYEYLRNLNRCAKDKAFVLKNILKVQCPKLLKALINECKYYFLPLNELLSLYAYILKTSFLSNEVPLTGLLERYVNQHPEIYSDMEAYLNSSYKFYDLPEVQTGVAKLDDFLRILIKFNLIKVNVTTLFSIDGDTEPAKRLTFTPIFNFEEKGLIYSDKFIYLSSSVVALILSRDFSILSLDSGRVSKYISNHSKFSSIGTSENVLANVSFNFDQSTFESIVGAELTRTASLIYSSILVRDLKNINVLLCTKDSGTLFINPTATKDIIDRNKEVLNYVISNNYGRDAIDMYDDPITYIRKNIGSNNTSLVYYLVCLYLFEDLFKVFGAHFDTFMDSRGRFYYKGGIGHPQSFVLARSAFRVKQPDAVINQQYDATEDIKLRDSILGDFVLDFREMINSSKDISIDCSDYLTSSKYQASFSYFDIDSNQFVDAPYLVGLKWLRDTLANYGIHDLDTL